MRPIVIGRKDAPRVMAVELLDQNLSTQILADNNTVSDQGELEWA